MTASAKPLARKAQAAISVLPAGQQLVRLLPRHWTGRLMERCRVSDRVVQDSVHGRSHGKCQRKVHEAAILMAFEHQREGFTPLLALAVDALAREPDAVLAAAA